MAAASGSTGDGGTTKSTSKSATKASGAGTKAKKPPRKKKSTAKGSSASSNQATYSAARAAQMELAGHRNSTAARLSDPLWYRVEDVLPAASEVSAMAEAPPKVLPEQVQIVETALSHNHLTRSGVTPQAFCVLLEQARRYALELVADAQDYAVCANRTEIGKADLQLASDMRPDHPISVTTQLTKLNLLASQINRVPLPPIPTQCYTGVLLPPKHHQLTARTFDVVSGAQVAQKMVQSTPSVATKKVSSSSSSKSTPKPSYGAARGRQIPVVLKGKEPSKEGGADPNAMDVSSPAPAPSLSAVPGSAPPHNAAAAPPTSNNTLPGAGGGGPSVAPS